MTEFWRKWLIATSSVTALAGLTLAGLAAMGATEIHDTLFEIAYLPGELDTPGGEVASFAIGIAGAVMVGWAATMLILLTSSGANGLPSNWRALTVGLVAWFVVDGIVSIASGAGGNLVLNISFGDYTEWCQP